MQDATFLKYQGAWIAHVRLNNGKDAFLSLTEKLTDQQGEALNRHERAQRLARLLALAKVPIAVDPEQLEAGGR